MRVPLYYISRVPYRCRPTNVEKSVAWVQCLRYRSGHTDHATQPTLSVVTTVFNRHSKRVMHLSESALHSICACLEVAIQPLVRFLKVKFVLWPNGSWSNVAYICPDLTILSNTLFSSFRKPVCACFWWKLVELHAFFGNIRQFLAYCVLLHAYFIVRLEVGHQSCSSKVDIIMPTQLGPTVLFDLCGLQNILHSLCKPEMSKNQLCQIFLLLLFHWDSASAVQWYKHWFILYSSQ